MIEVAKIKSIAFVGAFLGLFFIVPGVSGFARGYNTDDSMLKPGMVVAISDQSTTEKSLVERASNKHPYSIIGIASAPADNQVTIASAGQQVYVTTSGEVMAYVSDMHGEVEKGDILTISPLKGILSRAPEDSALVLGIALEDSTSKAGEEYSFQAPEGEKTTKVVSIRINFDRKSGISKEPDSSLERLGKSIAGKNVGEIRVMAAIIIFLVVLTAEASILYGAISSAITSLGRNPLARQAIKHELVRVVIVAFAVLIFGLGSIFLILKV